MSDEPELGVTLALLLSVDRTHLTAAHLGNSIASGLTIALIIGNLLDRLKTTIALEGMLR